MNTLETYYSEPLAVNDVFLCHLNLVLAIGLLFATPKVGTNDAHDIDRLRSSYPDQSETFFRTAKSLSPATNLEDGDIWSIQALLLMALYLLTKSIRNPAYNYIGK